MFLEGFLSKSFRYYLSAKSFYLSFISILHIYRIRSLSKKTLEISNKMWRLWGSPPRSTDYKMGLKRLQEVNIKYFTSIICL
jgi:hypothetical protein